MKKLVCFILSACVVYSATAETIVTCPSVAEIQSGHLNEWLPLYQDNEELAFDADLLKVKAHVTRFVKARWDYSYLESAHCFYEGDDPIFNRIVFAQDAWNPVSTSTWSWVVPRFAAECLSDVQSCGFIK